MNIVHLRILDTVHIWYCSSLVILSYMVEYQNSHAQIWVEIY